MHTLYGAHGSGSAAIEVALRLCKLPYRVVNAAPWEPGAALEKLAQVNPLRQVPALVLPGGEVLTESAAILMHLGLAAQAGRLLPRATGARSQSIRGLVFIAANCYSAISVGDYPERWTTATTQTARDKVRQAARLQLHQHWVTFADTFGADIGAEAYLSGPRLGALDVLAAVVSKWSGARAHLAEHRPAFSALLQRVEAHAAVAPVFREHWPA